MLAEWQVMKEMAQMMIKTGFLPQGLGSPEQVIFVIMKGKEMGMGPMQALQHIEVIQGKLCIKPEGMLAQVLKFCPQATIEYLQNDDQACKIRATKGNISNTFSFTIEDAAKAGLDKKENWKKYTRAMLRSRCVGEMCRSMFPETIQGLSYTPEEIENLSSKPDPEPEEPKNVTQPQISQKVENISPPVEPRKATKTMREQFAALGVKESDLAEFIGKPIASITPEDKKILMDLLKAMQDGYLLKEDMMQFAYLKSDEAPPHVG